MPKNSKPGGTPSIRDVLIAAAKGMPPFAPKEKATAPAAALRESDGVRARTLAAAMRILEEKGAGDLSLRAIADSAGIGLASIYHYFANKEDLLLHLAITGFRELREEMERFRTLPEHAPPMRASARGFFNFVLTRPALLSLMFDEQLMAGHESLREAEQETLLTYLAAVEDDGRIPPAYRENAAHAIWALGRGIAAIIASHPPGGVPAERIEKLFAGAIYLIDRSG